MSNPMEFVHVPIDRDNPAWLRKWFDETVRVVVEHAYRRGRLDLAVALADNAGAPLDVDAIWDDICANDSVEYGEDFVNADGHTMRALTLPHDRGQLCVLRVE